MNGKVDLTTSREVLDIAITSMLRPSRNRASSFSAYFLLNII